MGGCVIRNRCEYGKNVHGETVLCMDMDIVQLHMGGMCNIGTIWIWRKHTSGEYVNVQNMNMGVIFCFRALWEMAYGKNVSKMYQYAVYEYWCNPSVFTRCDKLHMGRMSLEQQQHSLWVDDSIDISYPYLYCGDVLIHTVFVQYSHICIVLIQFPCSYCNNPLFPYSYCIHTSFLHSYSIDTLSPHPYCNTYYSHIHILSMHDSHIHPVFIHDSHIRSAISCPQRQQVWLWVCTLWMHVVCTFTKYISTYILV